MTQREANKFFKKGCVRIELFKSSCHFFFTREDWNTAMDWRGEDIRSLGGGITYTSVLINRKTKEEESDILCVGIFEHTPEVVAHECIHAANHILERIGYERKDYHDEILPYLVGYLVQECNKLMEKHNAI